jgi:hypothetical protein
MPDREKRAVRSWSFLWPLVIAAIVGTGGGVALAEWKGGVPRLDPDPEILPAPSGFVPVNGERLHPGLEVPLGDSKKMIVLAAWSGGSPGASSFMYVAYFDPPMPAVFDEKVRQNAEATVRSEVGGGDGACTIGAVEGSRAIRCESSIKTGGEIARKMKATTLGAARQAVMVHLVTAPASEADATRAFEQTVRDAARLSGSRTPPSAYDLGYAVGGFVTLTLLFGAIASVGLFIRSRM